jgi:deoxyribodipyrimidine photo-lyase
VSGPGLWLHHALTSLDDDLRRSYGARIVFKRGPYADALRETCVAAGATEVHASRRYEPAQAHVDGAVSDELASKHVTLHLHSGRA